MRKVGRKPQKLQTLNLFSLLQTENNSLYDPANRQSFLSQVDAGLARALESESTLHGIRVQAMFCGMVASFDSVRLIKEEDVGDCYYGADSQMLVPDFRVVAGEGESWLIETKNHFSKDPMRRYRIRSSDLQALQRYSELVRTPLRIAIYWAPWNQWTLNDPLRFSPDGNYEQIDFLKAMKENEMAMLGDYSIGTTYPLTLSLIAATDQPREISSGGRASLHIGRAEIRSSGVLIEDKLEQNIALYLMMFGKWVYDGGRVEVDAEGLPAAIIHTCSPEEITPNQGFEMIGSLSSLYSQHYNALTLEQQRVSRLNVKDPTSLAPVISKEFKRKQLPIWRFIQQPNYE